MNPSPAIRPLSLEELGEASTQGSLELNALARLREAGLELTPLCLVSADTEERFYRLNNLPAQLNDLFAGIDTSNPDEDDIELLAPEAEKLLKQHYLLDELIDSFYEALQPLPPRLRIRRPDGHEGRTALRGRPALLALKETWADDWGFDALMARLEQTHSIALAARPVMVGAVGLEPADTSLNEQASSILGKSVSVMVDPEYGITKVSNNEQ